jgi:hypothetical protein
VQIADHFKELWSSSFGTSRGSIQDSLASDAYSDQEEITNYLRAGHEIITVMGSSQDVLSPGERILGGDSIYTDGDWLWRGDLWFYVRTHHVLLPDDFLTHIRSTGHSMPHVKRPRLLQILDYVEERW